MISLKTLQDAIWKAQSGWTGCDWHTKHGPRELDLYQLRSRQANLAAKATRGEESECWRDASRWLADVERRAEQAAERAARAAATLESRDYPTALSCLEEAVELARPFATAGLDTAGLYEHAWTLCRQFVSEPSSCR